MCMVRLLRQKCSLKLLFMQDRKSTKLVSCNKASLSVSVFGSGELLWLWKPSLGQFEKSEKGPGIHCLYTFVHALNFPTFWEFLKIPQHLSASLRACSHIFNCILLTMAAIQGLDFALSYALQQLWWEAMMPKPQQREFVKCVHKGKDLAAH